MKSKNTVKSKYKQHTKQVINNMRSNRKEDMMTKAKTGFNTVNKSGTLMRNTKKEDMKADARKELYAVNADLRANRNKVN
jgi:hypothetical protein